MLFTRGQILAMAQPLNNIRTLSTILRFEQLYLLIFLPESEFAKGKAYQSDAIRSTT